MPELTIAVEKLHDFYNIEPSRPERSEFVLWTDLDRSTENVGGPGLRVSTWNRPCFPKICLDFWPGPSRSSTTNFETLKIFALSWLLSRAEPEFGDKYWDLKYFRSVLTFVQGRAGARRHILRLKIFSLCLDCCPGPRGSSTTYFGRKFSAKKFWCLSKLRTCKKKNPRSGLGARPRRHYQNS